MTANNPPAILKYLISSGFKISDGEFSEFVKQLIHNIAIIRVIYIHITISSISLIIYLYLYNDQ
jgi:hypothetical protein